MLKGVRKDWKTVVLLLLLSMCVFWGNLAIYGITSRNDSVKDYLLPGFQFFNGNASFADIHYNIGYTLLVGLVSALTDSPELKTMVFYVSFPAFLLSIAFLFYAFRRMGGARRAAAGIIVVLCSRMVTGSVVAPLSESAFLACFCALIWLSFGERRSPVVVGLVAGLAFWFRNHALLFLPFWPILYADTTSLKAYVRNGTAMFVGVLPGVGGYWLLHGSLLSGAYTKMANPGSVMQGGLGSFFSAVGDQIVRFSTFEFEVLVFFLALTAVLVPAVRGRHWRLWAFTFATFFFQMAWTVNHGSMRTLRPSVYMYQYVLMAFLATEAVWAGLSKVLARMPRACVAAGLAGVLVAVVTYSQAWRITDFVTQYDHVAEKMHAFPLDHRESFEGLAPDAKILAETYHSQAWSSVSFPNGRYVQLGKPALFKGFSKKLDFAVTLEQINKLAEDPVPDALVVWRTGPIDLPERFSDRFGNVYSLKDRRLAYIQMFALYTVDRGAPRG